MAQSNNNHFDEDSKYAKLAKEYLAHKVRDKYYTINLYDEDAAVVEYMELTDLIHLTQEEVKALRQLRDKYGEDEFCKHIDEAYEDEDKIPDQLLDDDIVNIDLENHTYLYRFTRHDYKSDGEICSHEMLQYLSDSDYIHLLAYYLEDQSMNFNKLRYVDRGLWSALTYSIDSQLCDQDFYIWDYPYFITMDEIKEDAERIIEIHPELRNGVETIGYMLWP